MELPSTADQNISTTYIERHGGLTRLLYLHNTMSIGNEGDTTSKHASVEESPNDQQERTSRSTGLRLIYTWTCIVLLFVNYFLAQYDKFILSYFSTHLSETLGL